MTKERKNYSLDSNTLEKVEELKKIFGIDASAIISVSIHYLYMKYGYEELKQWTFQKRYAKERGLYGI